MIDMMKGGLGIEHALFLEMLSRCKLFLSSFHAFSFLSMESTNYFEILNVLA